MFKIISTEQKEINIGFVEAHPDDGRIAGYTILAEIYLELLKLITHGIRIKISTIIFPLTLGQMGAGTPDVRRKESENAARVLHAKSVPLDFFDTQIEVDNNSILKVAKFIRQNMFHILFAPYPTRGEMCLYGNNAHPDHFNTGELVTRAVLYSNIKKIDEYTVPHKVSQLYYYDPPLGVVPNIMVPISNQAMDLALEAAAQYESQNSYKGPMTFEEFLKTRRTMYHSKMGVSLPSGYQYAEPLVSASPMLMSPSMLLGMF